MMEPKNRYVFLHKYNGVVNKIILHDCSAADEIVRQFRYFLQSVSFHNITIRNAFQEITDELDEDLGANNEKTESDSDI